MNANVQEHKTHANAAKSNIRPNSLETQSCFLMRVAEINQLFLPSRVWFQRMGFQGLALNIWRYVLNYYPGLAIGVY